MATELTAELERAVDEATRRFSTQSSDLHQALAKELKTLGRHHAALVAAFQARTEKREAAVQSVQAVRIAEAKAELERVSSEQAPLIASGNPHLELIAKSLIEFAQGRVVLAESLERSDMLQRQHEDAIDASLLRWIEELSLLSVAAIDSDKARKRAIAVINGGLIVGGMTTLPFAPAVSALLAALLLARQWRDAEAENDTDSDAARIERATRLLAHVNSIMQAWLQIL